MIKIIKLGDMVYENIEPFWVDENGNQVWNVPNDIEQLKQALIDTVKWQAWMKLKDTDWVVTKCIELGLDVATKYPDIASKRQAVREWSNQKEEEIKACNTIEELLVLDIKIPF